MALFVHLATHEDAGSIRRAGITRLRQWGSQPHGVFAMPVVLNFVVGHQWLRELKRRNAGPILGVYFRIPDEESVWVGHYHGRHQRMTAAQAAAFVMRAAEPLGFQVIIPRIIGRQELHKIRTLPQVVGWRYFPGAHGKPPCGCDYCQRAEYGARQVRIAWKKRNGWTAARSTGSR